MIKRKIEDLSIQEAFDSFISEKELIGISKSTIGNYIQSYNYFIRDANINSKAVFKAIDKDLVESYINTLQRQNISLSSKNHYITDLRAFLYWGMDYKYIDRFKIKLLKGQVNTIHYYTDDELELLLTPPSDKCDFVEYRTYVIICFVLATGARANTLLNIRLDDINFKDREVTYRCLKNKNIAIIPLSNTLMNVLTTYLKEWNISDWLFPEINGSQLTYNALTCGLTRYCKERHVKRRGIHALRHNFARGWIKNNGNAFTLQQMLTHSDISMTRHYVQLFSNDLHNNLETFSPLDTIKRVKTKQMFRQK